MPRIGHKEGCQCAVCKKLPVPAPAPVVPAGPTFGSTVTGALFEYPVGRGGQVYRKCSVGTNVTLGTAVNTTSPSPGGSSAVSFEENAEVKPR